MAVGMTMTGMARRVVTGACLAAAIAGCATAAPTASRQLVGEAGSLALAPYATDDAARAAAGEVDRDPAYAGEPVPDAAALARLEAASPDRLVANAPPEPGLAADGAATWPHPPAGDLGNFGKVTDRLFRGARPTDKGLEQLAGMGVKTIVNFENDKAVVEHERQWCQAHGIEFHSIALSIITPPAQSKIDEFLKYATDGSKLPLYFHCMQGRDRTGTAAFCYRIHEQHWRFDPAYQEMRSYHFHAYLLGLQYYIRRYASSQHAG